jgi:hypothetical protein
VSIEQFTVQPTFVILVAIALAAVGIIILVTGLFSRPLEAPKLYSFGRVGVGVGKGTRRWAFIIAGIILIGTGVGLYALGGIPSTITVGSGYVYIQSPPFGTGNINVTSSEIASAYVGQIGSGNLTLSKQYGTNAGNLNIGVFTLGNGKTANVVSNNPTDLIIQLNNSQYVILGTSNTTALAASFSQSVYHLNSITLS